MCVHKKKYPEPSGFDDLIVIVYYICFENPKDGK